MGAKMLTLYTDVVISERTTVHVIVFPNDNIAAYKRLSDALMAIQGTDYDEWLMVNGDETYLVTHLTPD